MLTRGNPDQENVDKENYFLGEIRIRRNTDQDNADHDNADQQKC